MKAMPVAEAKRDFRAVLDAAERGEQTIILRRGKPVAAVVPTAPGGERRLPVPQRPGGLLAVAGLFADWESLEEDMAAIVGERAPLPPGAWPSGRELAGVSRTFMKRTQ